MRLPGGEHAVVEIKKLRGYCLNPLHPRGRHKARVFSSVLGLTIVRTGEQFPRLTSCFVLLD